MIVAVRFTKKARMFSALIAVQLLKSNALTALLLTAKDMTEARYTKTITHSIRTPHIIKALSPMHKMENVPCALEKMCILLHLDGMS